MSVIIKPLSADLIKGHDFLFLKKSPYVSIQLGGESYRTFPDKRGGKTP